MACLKPLAAAAAAAAAAAFYTIRVTGKIEREFVRDLVGTKFHIYVG